jgi:phosphonate transport system ATP-binding protein
MSESKSGSGRPVFELQHVTRRFGDMVALADVNLRILAGERVALVGPSGAGKSTLISLLNGTALPDEGRVCVLGQDLARLNLRQLRRVQQQIGTVYQQFHLVDNLRVIHNVNAGNLGRWSFWKAAFSLLWPLDSETCLRALTLVGIPEKLYERTGRLSGGQQQRVALARVLVQNPVAILADEPIASLDPERGREIMDLCCDLTEKLGKTLVVSIHAIEFAYTHCARVIGLRQGRILFDVPPTGLSAAMVTELYEIKDPYNSHRPSFDLAAASGT